MTFESITRNAQALQRKVIMATPEALRECADRLDHASKGALAGQSILCELTPGITVIFKPENGQKVYDYIESHAEAAKAEEALQ